MVYKMVFVPFATADHHKKSVTVGIGENIKNCSNRSRSSNKTSCRICVAKLKTQIMDAEHNEKTSRKEYIIIYDYSYMIYPNKYLIYTYISKLVYPYVTGDLFKNTDYKMRFNKLIKLDEFEKKWEWIINEFNLEDKRWFNDMFELREKWIPTYFNDARMSGLTKTTLRLENMNSFFNTYSQSGNLLLYFMMNYDTAIQKQRNTENKLDHEAKNAKNMLQKFIQVHCFMKSKKKSTKELYKVEQLDKNNDLKREFEYIENRWRKDVISRHYDFGRHAYDIGDSEINRFINRTNVEEVGKLMGISIPKDIRINLPNVQSKKGSGKKNKIQSAAKITYKNSNKQTRRCSGCGERAPHNLRHALSNMEQNNHQKLHRYLLV
uniref:Protein FAR1-RELATED SEQUENCE n=1 Tax=Lactuca sativa TaxID=4236 RepID=A0A9R1WKT5_LACSA|nr:hypothetical protein LSAT_V11C100042640 [Lactuca sativa]